MKQWKRFLVILTMCAVLVGSMHNATKVQAVVPIAIGAWEIITILLLSAGVTIETYNLLDRAIPDEFKEEWVNQFCQQLEDAKQGVGTAVTTFIDTYKGTYESTKAVTMALGRIAWDEFRTALNTLFNGQDVTSAGGYVSYNITTAEAFCNVLGLTNVSQSVQASIENYLQQVQATNGKASVYMVARQGDFASADKKYFNVFMMNAPDGVTVSGNYNEINKLFKVTYSTAITGYMQVQMDLSSAAAEWATLDAYRTDSNETGYSWYYTQATPQIQQLMVGSNVDIQRKIKVKPGFQSLLQDKDKVLITPGTQVVDGVITGDIIWTIPATLDDILQGVLDDVITIEDALAQLKVIPVDATDDKAVEDAIGAVGTIPTEPPYDGDYTLNLSSFFPFCLPFDFVDMIKCLQAEPQAPKFTFKMPTGYNGSAVIWDDYEIDLSIFDTVATVCRAGEFLAFCIGLAMITRNQFIRG